MDSIAPVFGALTRKERTFILDFGEGFLAQRAEMKAVVVGGHSRNIGKTSVMARLIRELNSFPWTAVKITQHDHETVPQGGRPHGSALAPHTFVLTEEGKSHGAHDSCRYLAAGARRSLWLRVRPSHFADAIPALPDALGADEYVMIESNSVLDFLEPAVYLLVVDSSKRDFKSSARLFLARADALVPIESYLETRNWPAFDPRHVESKPVFPVSSRDYFSAELCRFVRQRIELSAARPFSHLTARSEGKKEPLWQH